MKVEFLVIIGLLLPLLVSVPTDKTANVSVEPKYCNLEPTKRLTIESISVIITNNLVYIFVTTNYHNATINVFDNNVLMVNSTEGKLSYIIDKEVAFHCILLNISAIANGDIYYLKYECSYVVIVNIPEFLVNPLIFVVIIGIVINYNKKGKYV